MGKMEKMDTNIKQSVPYQQKIVMGKQGGKDQEAGVDFQSFA